MTKQLSLQQAKYIEKRTKLDELRKAANKAASQAAKEWKSQNPSYNDLEVKPLNLAYIRNKVGVTKGLLKLAERSVWVSSDSKTQKQILDEVNTSNPEYDLKPTIWQKELSAPLKKRILDIVNGSLATPLNFKDCSTLSEIRKTIKTSRIKAAKSVSFKPEITFTNEMVVINKQTYPLEKKKVNGKIYYIIRVKCGNKRQVLRLDVLAQILKS